jgi:hypothetical protein
MVVGLVQGYARDQRLMIELKQYSEHWQLANYDHGVAE